MYCIQYFKIEPKINCTVQYTKCVIYTLYSTEQYGTVQYGTVQYGTGNYSTVYSGDARNIF